MAVAWEQDMYKARAARQVRKRKEECADTCSYINCSAIAHLTSRFFPLQFLVATVVGGNGAH